MVFPIPIMLGTTPVASPAYLCQSHQVEWVTSSEVPSIHHQGSGSSPQSGTFSPPAQLRKTGLHLGNALSRGSFLSSGCLPPPAALTGVHSPKRNFLSPTHTHLHKRTFPSFPSLLPSCPRKRKLNSVRNSVLSGLTANTPQPSFPKGWAC